MKNIFLLETDKPSYLFIIDKSKMFVPEAPYLSYSTVGGRVHKTEGSDIYRPQFVYITNEETVKEGDWCMFLGLSITHFKVTEVDGNKLYCGSREYFNINMCKKVVLTNDTFLIADGVQEVNSSFLSFYAENTPDYVEVKREEDGQYVDHHADGSVIEGIYENYSLVFTPKNKLEIIKVSQLNEDGTKTDITDKHELWYLNTSIEYSKLLSEFETLEGITSNMFDGKDWVRFDRFIENCEKETKTEEEYDRTYQSISLSEVDKEENIINQWLEKNGNPEIGKQVEREAEELELDNYINDLLEDYDDIDKARYGLLIRAGATWQKNRMHSEEEEVIALINKREDYINSEDNIFEYKAVNQWFKNYKK